MIGSLETLPRAVLFDHDGVLVASEALHWQAWQLLLKEIQLPYDEPLIKALVGKPAPVILKRILDQHKPGWKPEHYYLDALALRKNDHYMEIAAVGLVAYPGVAEGLAWLKSQGVKTAVVSNSKRRELESALRNLRLFDYFDEVVSRDDIQPPKPDPTPYLFAAGTLGVEPHDVLAVEDSPTGIEAALVARMPSAAILTNFSREVMQAPVPGRPDLKPVWICESMVELFSKLKTLKNA